MPNPTYGGASIFGFAVTMELDDHPRVNQENHYFGLSGAEVLDGGFHTATTHVTGQLSGVDALAYESAVYQFRSFKDGVARELVTTGNGTYENVLLTSFREKGRLRQSPDGYFFREYEAVFTHLSET